MDGSGFPRKGTESAGIGRQYCNATGKVDSCQVGVYLAYATPKGYTFLDSRLHLPEEWFSCEYAIRRKNCGIPEETTSHMGFGDASGSVPTGQGYLPVGTG